MKDILKFHDVTIPEGVTVSFKSRNVVVTGPRGTLKKSFQHVDCELVRVSKDKIRVQVYHGNRKHVACIRTVASHIQNLIKGVTKGFLYKLRLVYAHFPINANVVDGGKTIEIRNFLGEKVVRRVPMLEGVTIANSQAQKDELIIQGNDIECVSQSAADIQQSVLVKGKDIRKFLDGIYVSEKTTISE
ncbi:large subunit ribosomal protein L9e, variant [Catenaria anguillulae PL171]|uniref:Large subunit ribosomal protein L9e, variant n=1 Tax=Catenaria anguillulae PL171 TaxID=765915 RepID=A0A1Y2HNN6_9FUNG|nr:large subunit ribosomal protein L9e, variant [Catenaria anguillulae PL171]